MEKIRVVILEDHQAMIDGYRYRLEVAPSIEVVATAMYGNELETVLANNQPIHVLILDIQVSNSEVDPGRYPILHVIPNLRREYPGLRILVISVYKQASLIKSIMDSGASGYILKDDRETHQNLTSVVRGVAGGSVILSREAHEQFLRKVSKKSRLSPRQEEILYLCASHPDWSSKQIGKEAGFASATVRNVLSEIYGKLGVQTRTAAVESARKYGLIPPVDALAQ